MSTDDVMWKKNLKPTSTKTDWMLESLLWYGENGCNENGMGDYIRDEIYI